MKKIFIFFILFFTPLFVFANNDIDWQDFDQSCFYKISEIESPEADTIKVKTPPNKDLFFIQNNQFLPNRVFDYGSQSYLNYEVVEAKGIADGAMKYVAHLNDNNIETSLFFDPYFNEEKEILLDLGEIIEANSFKFQMSYKGSYTPHFVVSGEGTKYFAAKNVDNHSFRFLKITFKNDSDTVIDKNLSIEEINFLTPDDYVYLVKSNLQDDIQVFTEYMCKDKEKVLKTANIVADNTRKTAFSINSETKLYKTDYIINPIYNEDIDGDGWDNFTDNCPYIPNNDQLDSDGDIVGDRCDLDNGVKNYHENDSDSDGVGDVNDNCIYIYNPLQVDSNADKRGDLCSDDDGDGVIGYKDNCINISNRDQADVNVNSIGDACEFDKDNDGVFDSIDNCMTAPNVDQADQDNDGIGDLCDNCDEYNPTQFDKNNNNLGDRCEEEEMYRDDEDKDGIKDYDDNCPKTPNNKQEDIDKDGVGDVCDNCLEIQNPDQEDVNQNGEGDVCEDSDGDGILGYLDNCPGHANSDQADKNNNGIGNVCEDEDGDGIVSVEDNCPFDYNKDQLDIDKDGVGEKCDEKDDRFIESNPVLFYGFIIVVTAIFLVLIGFMIYKINQKDENDKVPSIENSEDENN